MNYEQTLRAALARIGEIANEAAGNQSGAYAPGLEGNGLSRHFAPDSGCIIKTLPDERNC